MNNALRPRAERTQLFAMKRNEMFHVIVEVTARSTKQDMLLSPKKTGCPSFNRQQVQ